MPPSVVSSFTARAESHRRERRAVGRRRAPSRHQIEFLDRDVAAVHWKQQAVELALLIGTTDGPGHGSDPTWAVFALARASALGRRGSGTTGVRRLEIRDWHLLPKPVPVDDIVGELPPNEARWWRENLHSACKPIPPNTDEVTLRALRTRVPGLDAIVAAVRGPSALTAGVEVAGRPSLQSARDAGISAVRVFSPDWRDLQPTARSNQPIAPELELFIAAVTENDLIQDDIVPFEGWQQHRSRGGWVEFQSAGR
jgi:hypothetical protein